MGAMYTNSDFVQELTLAALHGAAKIERLVKREDGSRSRCRPESPRDPGLGRAAAEESLATRRTLL